jgi:hypothetical protein
LLLCAIANRRGLDRFPGRVTARTSHRRGHLDTRDCANPLGLSHDYEVIELYAQEADWLVSGPLSELHLAQEGIVIPGVHRSHGEYLGAPHGTTEMGDTVLAHGRLPLLTELDERHVGREGDVAHRQAVARQRQIIHQTDLDADAGESR